MTYREARVYLDEVSKYGSVLGLDTIRELLNELGNPQDELKFIHIAGTNGKGSVLAYISTILSECGFQIGRYVSPTVVDYLEKIQVDGSWIPEEVFTELVEDVQKAIVRMETNGKGNPTVFEVETAIAFLYFQRMHCDYVVLETGLGGILDATNIVKTTKLAVFTTISRDHMGFLGDTLREIAENKAGIIKPGCMVVSAEQSQEVREVLEQKAVREGCAIRFVQRNEGSLLEESYRGQRFSYKEYKKIEIQLVGRYQVLNAMTACEAIWEFEKMLDRKLDEEVVKQGFKNTIWRGRFTCLQENPIVIVDGAHNEDAAQRLRETVENYFPDKKLIFIMGVFKDKEYKKIVELMAPLAKKIYTIDLPNEERTLKAAELKKEIEACWNKMESSLSERQVETADGIEDAVRLAIDGAKSEDVILAFGSLSYLGHVMDTIEKK